MQNSKQQSTPLEAEVNALTIRRKVTQVIHANDQILIPANVRLLEFWVKLHKIDECGKVSRFVDAISKHHRHTRCTRYLRTDYPLRLIFYTEEDKDIHNAGLFEPGIMFQAMETFNGAGFALVWHTEEIVRLNDAEAVEGAMKRVRTAKR